MGLLDDAIREHLELKRRHGADATEVAQQEREALGPVRAPVEGSAGVVPPDEQTAVAQAEPDDEYEPSELDAGAEGAAADDGFPEPAPVDDEATLMHPSAAPEQEPWPAQPPAADPELGQVGPETVEFDVEKDNFKEAADAALSYPPEAPAPAASKHPAAAEPPAPDPPPEQHEHEQPEHEPKSEPEPDAEAIPEAGSEPPPGGVEPDQGESEDVLEETPEFLQETPEHDRLWFEQRPPRDFDFDK
jgi:hypothetical protein